MDKFTARAMELRAIVEPHYNCAQSVLLPFTEARGIDDDTALKFAANFGGGMKTGLTCGALTGALMVLGLYGVSDITDAASIQAWFRSENDGLMDCAELVRNYLNKEQTEDKKPYCDGLVLACVEKVEEILREKGIDPNCML